VWISPETDFSVFELDELFWFISERKSSKTGINTYIMTMYSRLPRQIVGFDVDNSVNKNSIQSIVDSVRCAKTYCTDGGQAYPDVIFGGKHVRNLDDKSDTHGIESSNADLRHYIKGLSRKSRCFFRTYETLIAVLSVFIDAYNKFGEWKLQHRKPVKHKSDAKHLHRWRYPAVSIVDFL
jgi:IS1 family transposase